MVVAVATVAFGIVALVREPVVEALGWNIDATTADAASPDLPGGEPSGLSQLARTPLSSSFSQSVLASENGAYPVVGSVHGVRVYDAATGEERWHYLDSYAGLDEDRLAVGSGRLVAPMYDSDLGSSFGSNPYVFDLASGRKLGEIGQKDAGEYGWLPLRDSVVALPGVDGLVKAFRFNGSLTWNRAWRAPGKVQRKT